ncbi:acylphosphatase [Guptibacillus algicola]|uniref:acylphosphatase n=1 Tax=Guptibacillus algicola TaxID=225844 RepID=UPI001CD712DC|nr:acylphosphatase [Alkalihalobacillus algicola]MCA0989339.1 acylphosphatase [Alkalihalobacillus algicola]
MKRYHLIVSGRVQGVGFRAFTQQKALEYNINGYVRNTTDGSVEIEAQGEEEQINQFISSVKKGSPFSSVDDVDANEEEVKQEEGSFSIRY